MKQFDLVVPINNPGFSTKDRTGKVCILIERHDEENQRYMSVTEIEDNPVSYPLIEKDVEVVGNLRDLVKHLDRKK